MINFSKVLTASHYNTRHLSHNDYYEEGCTVEGYWFGRGAASLGLSGTKDQQAWQALCANKHPETGKKLTARSPKIQAFDFVVSAPKAVSVLAMVGGDSRLIEAHQAAAQLAMEELERFAARRLREGDHFDSEDLVTCGNITALRYDHTAARGVGGEIDPQVHTHFLIANRVQDPTSGKWYALSEREMASAVPYAREVYRNALARQLKAFGYRIENRQEGFGIVGLAESIERKFSQRSVQRDEAIAQFKAKHEREPTKREIAKLVKTSRAKKMPQIRTAQVLARQQRRLTVEEREQIQSVIKTSRHIKEHKAISEGQALSFCLEDLLERNSTVKETELLKNALIHARGDLDLTALKIELERRLATQEVFRFGSHITTKEMLLAEENLCAWVREGRGVDSPFGMSLPLPGHFTDQQRAVIRGILGSCDQVTALIGDAGTSKTTCAEYIAKNIKAAGREVLGLAPTGSAVAELRQVVTDCDTLQGFLASPKKQREAFGKVLLVDEAGMVDVRSMAKLAALSQNLNCRVILIGDTKQNRSVGAGDAFRCLLEEGSLSTHHLTEIWRQTDPAFKKAVQLMAQGKGAEAFDAFHKLGTVSHVPKEQELFAKAAKEYVRAVQAGKSVLAVSPVWSEINAFHESLRPQLKKAGLLGKEQSFKVLEPDKTFTTARKRDFRKFEVGHVLRFYRKTDHVKAGEEVRVIEKKLLGLVLEKADGTRFSFRAEDADKFTVYREKTLPIAPGEKLLFHANCPEAKVSTGDVMEVTRVNLDRSLTLKNGAIVPAAFRLLKYGYCLTSHGSQGKKAQVSISVMGEKGLRSAKAREAYVAHSRFQEKISVFTVDWAKAREVFQKASDRLLVKEVRQDVEPKTLLAARVQARKLLTPNQQENTFATPQRQIEELRQRPAAALRRIELDRQHASHAVRPKTGQGYRM